MITGGDEIRQVGLLRNNQWLLTDLALTAQLNDILPGRQKSWQLKLPFQPSKVDILPMDYPAQYINDPDFTIKSQSFRPA